MSEHKPSGEPAAFRVGATPCNTYSLATQGFVWAAISSVSGDFRDAVKSVNDEKPDETGNVNVTSIRYEDYSGDLNEVRADLTVLSGGIEYRLLTNLDYDSLSSYTDERVKALSADSEAKFTVLSAASGGWNSTEATVETLSGNWENAKTETIAHSGEWNSVYTTVTESSGGWINGVTAKVVPFGESEPLSYYTSDIENPSRGDILILKKYLVEDDDKLYAYSSFSFNGKSWVPVAGSYDANGVYAAENVFFTENLSTSYSIGNITVPASSGIETIEAKGKNLKQVFDTIFFKELYPSKTNPTVTATFSNMGPYETGTVVVPTYSLSYHKGSYTYGPESNANVNGYTVSFNGATRNSQSGDFGETTVTDAMSSDSNSLKMAAYASYDTDTETPVTNTGNPYPSAKITEGNTATVYSAQLKSYRQAFYGALNSKSDVTDSAFVRSLEASSGSYPVKGSTELPLSYGIGAIRAVFAYPAALGDVVSINDGNAFGADIKEAFTKSVVAVFDATESGNPVDYNVYVKDAALPNDTANVYTLHI